LGILRGFFILAPLNADSLAALLTQDKSPGSLPEVRAPAIYSGRGT